MVSWFWSDELEYARQHVYGIGAGALPVDEFVVAMVGIVALTAAGVLVTHALFGLLDVVAPKRGAQ